MPKLPRTFNNAATIEMIGAAYQQTTKLLDGQISFGKTNTNSGPGGNSDHADLQIWKATGTTPGVANTEFAISHNLTWIPWFYEFILDRAGQLYQLPNTGTAWTAATNSTQGHINLKCTVASANFVIIIF